MATEKSLSFFFLLLLVALEAANGRVQVVEAEPEEQQQTRRTSGEGPFRKMFPKFARMRADKNMTGDPLFLTPLLKKGDFTIARTMARVDGTVGAMAESYAGYITVNRPLCESNLFFWYFPATFKNVSPLEPMVLWLQGGPGGSSLFGLFIEHGPFSVGPNLTLHKRDDAWTLTNNVIYVDQPVGTGFSFTRKDACYAKTEVDVANDLYEFVRQFFMMFPELSRNDFYVTGESYAGKYVPALAYKIHMENQKAKKRSDIVPLKGIAIGDGLCDPVTMQDYGGFLDGIGLLDAQKRDVFRKYAALTIKYINAKQFVKAFQVFDDLLNGDLSGHPSYFTNATGFSYYFNYLLTEPPKEFGYYPKFLQLNETRKSIHVGDLPYNDGKEVEEHLIKDVMQSVKPWIEVLLEKYKVLIYSGQVDIIIAHTLTQSFIDSLQWSGAKKYPVADRKQWRVDGELAGYVKEVDNLTQVLVRNAGHMVPYDQSKWAMDLINRFVKGKAFA